MPFEGSVGDEAGHQADGADGVIVGGDDDVNRVRVGVGVRHAYDPDVQTVRFGDGDSLAMHIDDEEHVRDALKVAQAIEATMQALQLPLEGNGLLRRQHIQFAPFLALLQPLHGRNSALDGDEVGESATQPALGDIGHAAALGFLANAVLRLALGAHEHNHAATGHQVTHGVGG